jgi:hypothetical protein
LQDSGIHQHPSQCIKPPVFSDTSLVSISGDDWETLPGSPRTPRLKNLYGERKIVFVSTQKEKASRRIYTLENTIRQLNTKKEGDKEEIAFYDKLIPLLQNILTNDEYVKYSPEVQNSLKNVIANLKMAKEGEEKEIKIEEEAGKILLWLLNNYKTNYGH